MHFSLRQAQIAEEASRFGGQSIWRQNAKYQLFGTDAKHGHGFGQHAAKLWAHGDDS